MLTTMQFMKTARGRNGYFEGGIIDITSDNLGVAIYIASNKAWRNAPPIILNLSHDEVIHFSELLREHIT